MQFDATSIYYDLGFVFRACGGYIFNYQNGAYDTSDIPWQMMGQYRRIISLTICGYRYGLITADVMADIARSNFRTENVRTILEALLGY